MRALAKVAVQAYLIWILWCFLPLAGASLTEPIQWARKVCTEVELIYLKRAVLISKIFDEPLPTAREFAGVIRTRLVSNVKSPLIDMWGRPYLYRRLGDGFEIRSIGPDGELWSKDDLLQFWISR